MTTAAEVQTVACLVCPARVSPTREGGSRPRDHVNASTGRQCEGPARMFRMADCTHCGQPADVEGCGSPLFHPEVWVVDGVEVGNAAAAAQIVRVTGQQYQWLARVPPKPPRRAPGHLGFRQDGVRFYDLAAVRAYSKNRPGLGVRPPSA